jgi:hypothetical protein
MIIHNPILTGSLTLNNVNLSTGNLVTTGSNTFVGNQILSGSLTVSGSVSATGTLTAQTLVVQTVTSSVLYSSGSNIFGNNIANTQVFTGSVLVTGSIGIGTTPSVSPIEILSNSDYAFRANRTATNSKSLIALYDSPTAATSSYLIAGVDPTGNIVGYSATGSFISVGTNGTGIKRDLILHNYDAQSVVIATNNTERMRVTSAGNVGIGTTPSYKLHIIESTTNGRAVQGVATATSGTNYGAVLVAEGIGATKNIGLYASAEGATTNVAAVFDNGNVGIGTSSPSSIFEVAQTNGIITQRGNTGYSVFRSYGGDGTNSDVVEFQIRNRVDGSNMVSIGNFTSHDLTFRTANTERMRITSAGLIGIGGANSGWTLAVNSISSNNSSTPHQIAIFGNSTSGATRGYLYIGSSAGIDWLVGKDTGGSGDNRFNLSLYTGEQRMVLYTNGNYSFAGSNVSDIRLKSNINTLSLNALDKISQFVPKSYTMNDHPDQIRYGFIAQEVKDILPDLISGTEGEKEYLGLDYNGVLTLTVKALQELKAEFDEYKTTHP